MSDFIFVLPLMRLLCTQKRTACAAQHFHWSSNLGGIMGETGEFDAFATIMAILRMRRKYPDSKPEEYYDLDEGFRDFVDCKPGAAAQACVHAVRGGCVGG